MRSANAFIYSLVNESISFSSFFLVIPSGTNLPLAWVAQPAKEKNVETLIWTDLASKEFECKKKKDESALVMGKDSYNFLN